MTASTPTLAETKRTCLTTLASSIQHNCSFAQAPAIFWILYDNALQDDSLKTKLAPMRNVYFNTVGVNYTTYGFAKHSQHTNILNHVLPGGFLCTGTGWPSFLHRLGYGIYSQIACRKARTAGHQGKSRRPWRSKPDYLQYFVALGAGLAYAWLMLG